MLINQIREAIGLAWTHPRNADKEVDAYLAEAITDEIMKVLSPKEPCLEDAKNLLVKNDLRAVVILSVQQSGTIQVDTYGDSKATCEVIGTWGQGLLGRGLSVVPFQTTFGWGWGGVPHTVTNEQIQEASPEVHEYISANTHQHAVSYEDDILLRRLRDSDRPRNDWGSEEFESIERLKLWGLISEQPGTLRPYAITQKGVEYLRYD
jgi:hypothetical protein